ncbi:MAG: response regulator [Oscillatoriales cyanobacterium SM2_2_1]|nr:response regulator [Oscillatoriales cyanobacterium SM2_2_1]
MRVLLVEDDALTTKILLHSLQKQHVVDAVADGLAGWEFAQTYPYELILLDLMLPHLDGVSLCRRLRQHHYGAWIIMITSRDRPEDRLAGLEAGADDYVTKPIDLAELEARIRNVSRRSAGGMASKLVWGDLTLDPARAAVHLGAKPVTLTKKEYAILELFLRYPYQVHSRFDIIDHIWTADDTPTEDTVKSHLRALRSKLRRAGARDDYFETLYGQGYRLNPALDPKNAPPAELGDRQQQLAPAWEHFQGRCWYHLEVLESFLHQSLSVPLQVSETMAQESLLGLSAITRTMGLTNLSLWLARLGEAQTLAAADLCPHLPVIRGAIAQYQDCAVSVLFTKVLWLVGEGLSADYGEQLKEMALFWHYTVQVLPSPPNWGAIAKLPDAVITTNAENRPDLPTALLLPAAQWAAVAPHPRHRLFAPSTSPEEIFTCLEALRSANGPVRLVWVGADAPRWVSILQPLLSAAVLRSVASGSHLRHGVPPDDVDLILLESDQVPWAQNLRCDTRWGRHSILVRSRHPVPADACLNPQWTASELAQWLDTYGRRLQERTRSPFFALKELQRFLCLAQRHQQPYSLAVLQTSTVAGLQQRLSGSLRQEDTLAQWGSNLVIGLYGSQQGDAIERLVELLGTEERFFWGGVAQAPVDGKTLAELYARALTASYQARQLSYNAIVPVGWVPLPMANSKLVVDVLLIAADDRFYQELSMALHLRSIHLCWLQDLATALTMTVEEPCTLQPRIVLVSDDLGDLDPLIMALERTRAGKQCPIIVLQSQSCPPILKNGVTDVMATTMPINLLVAEVRRYL